MATKKNGFNTGIASEYLVLSMLYRLNYEAYITMGNKKSVDIWIMRDDKTAVSIDVKSVREYDSIPVGNVEAKDNHYVIFVIYNKKFEIEGTPTLPDFYIVPSSYVVENRKEYELKAGGERYNIFKKDIEGYKNHWELLNSSIKSGNVTHGKLEKEMNSKEEKQLVSSRWNDCSTMSIIHTPTEEERKKATDEMVDNQTKHFVNLLLSENPENPYEVEFRYNAKGDIYGRYADGLVAFKLDALPDTEGKTVKLKLKWKSFSGEKSAEFDYCTRKSVTPESPAITSVRNSLNLQ